MARPRDEIGRWWEQRLAGLPKERREIASRGVEGLTPADWEAVYELHTRWRIAERTPEEWAELKRKEQRILRQMPPVDRNGVRYGAPWSFGLRARAARELWGEIDLDRARFVPLGL